jgi:Protein of unknown function (DUF3592)
MVTMVLLLAVVLALGAGALALYSQFSDGGESPEPDTGTETWRTVNAEVVSVLKAGSRTFLLVRYTVGSSLIHNDVLYPLAGKVPIVGQRVPIRYDPAAPARAVYDRNRVSGTPSRPTEHRRPVSRRPLTKA